MAFRHSYTSPLRYPGGKGILTNFMKLVVSKNDLFDGVYAEVFAGGAAIAWAMLFEEIAKKVYVNDISQSVYAFWHSVLYSTEELCRLIQDTPVTMEIWHKQRQIQQRASEHSLIDLGFSTFFLNRTNRSGILTGGVIGGKMQSGEWKLDARYNKKDLIERIKKIARYRQRIVLSRLDAEEFIANIVPTLPSDTLVYLDPPYYHTGQNLYQNNYKSPDHARLADSILKIRQPWVVSYDACSEIENLYEGHSPIKYSISYSAREKYAGKEIIFFGNLSTIPLVANPAAVKPTKSARPLLTSSL